jgi:hypothetical protein
VTIHLVDDGSPDAAAAAVVKQWIGSEVCRGAYGARSPWSALRVFRIGVDLRWNWLAARNVGAHAAPCGWMLLTDIDHVIPVESLEAVIRGRHDERVVYGFSRRGADGAVLAPHPNSWLITRSNYWRIGGYDEALSGHYGTDGDWRRRVAAAGRLEILSTVLERHEHIGDSSTVRYLRKQPVDAGVAAIVAKRGPEWRPRVLSFPWCLELEVR